MVLQQKLLQLRATSMTEIKKHRDYRFERWLDSQPYRSLLDEPMKDLLYESWKEGAEHREPKACEHPFRNVFSIYREGIGSVLICTKCFETGDHIHEKAKPEREAIDGHLKNWDPLLRNDLIAIFYADTDTDQE